MDTINMRIQPAIEIHYCTGCKWLARAAWVAQELLQTFEEELEGVTLKPSPEKGIFLIKLGEYIVWDRQKYRSFPQPADLKTKVRNILCPDKDLGHLDEKALKED